MLAHGALHVHTDLSHDGLWSLDEMAAFLREHHYQFVCVTEHSEDMDGAKIDYLRHICAKLSSPEFCVVPGIEYTCGPGLHITGAGCDVALDTADPVDLVRSIRKAGGFAVLAHPRRIGWQCPEGLIDVLNAVEVWNVPYDGKFLPRTKGLEFLYEVKHLNHGILAAVGLDLHRPGSFYPASVDLMVDRLDRQSIVAALISGNYTIESPFWSLQARSLPSRGSLARVRALRAVLDPVRLLRNRLQEPILPCKNSDREG